MDRYQDAAFWDWLETHGKDLVTSTDKAAARKGWAAALSYISPETEITQELFPRAKDCTDEAILNGIRKLITG